MELLINGAAPSDLSRVLGVDPGTDPKQVVLLLDEAAASRDADRIECAMLLAARTGLTRDAVPSLIALLALPCHERHEDIVQTLQALKDPRSIDALFAASHVKHAYLDYDEFEGLARKCTWALADIGTPDALEKLRSLAQSENEQIAGYAKKRLDCWEEERDRKGWPGEHAANATSPAASSWPRPSFGEAGPPRTTTPRDDARFAALFGAVETRMHVVQRIAAIVTLLLAFAGFFLALAASWYVQEVVLGWEHVFVSATLGAGGAAGGIALGRALQKAVLVAARPSWRNTLSRELGATDAEIDDVFAMLSLR